MIKYHRSSHTVSLKGGIAFEKMNLHVWFKGHFWYENQFFEDSEAAEMVAQAYRRGTLNSQIPEYNGFFFLMVLDKSARLLTWAHDRFGYDSHFYVNDADVFLLSDNIWDCLAGQAKRRIHEQSLLEFLRYRFITGERSLFEDVFVCRPANISRLLLDADAEIVQHCYYRFQHRPAAVMELEQGALSIHTTLKEVLHRWKNMKTTPWALTLTGGLDSRYLYAFMHEEKELSLHSFGSRRSEDLRLAQRVADATESRLIRTELDDVISQFYDAEAILNGSKKIGHSCFHYQGFALSHLFRKIPRGQSVMMGVDGFWTGLNATASWLHGANDPEEIQSGLYQELSSFLSAEDCERLTGISPQVQENRLRHALEQGFWLGENRYSSYIDWLFKHKARRYISSNYSMLSAYHRLIYPYDDYGMIDLALSMPSELLEHQNVFLYAYLNYGLKEGIPTWSKIPFEQMQIIPHRGKSYRLKRQHRPFAERLVNKFHSIPDARQSHPIPEYVRKNGQTLDRQLSDWQEGGGSAIIDLQELNKLLNKKRSQDLDFFAKPLSAVLSLMAMEKLMAQPENQVSDPTTWSPLRPMSQ